MPMLSHLQPAATAPEALNMEAWAAARALEKKGPIDGWLAPKASAARAPLALVHTALVLEISAELARPGDGPLTRRAEALVASDLDRLVHRAATMVRSLRHRMHSLRAGPARAALTC